MSDDLRWDLSCVALITAVEKRPGIYNRLHPDYKKDEKERLWLEICEEIIPNWNEMPLPERNSRVLLVQRKWKNLRDNFRKELKIQNQRKSSKYPKKKREYLYFKSMLFLEPFLKDAESAIIKNSQSYEDQSYNDQEENINLNCESEDSQNTSSSRPKLKNKRASIESSNYEFWEENGDSNNSSTNAQKNKRSKKSPILEIYEESENGDLNDMSNYTFHEDIDEDRYFLLSLLPSLRSLSSEQKLSVRVEFLQILQKVSFSTSEEDPLNTS